MDRTSRLPRIIIYFCIMVIVTMSPFANEADVLFTPTRVWELELTFAQENWYDILVQNYESETYLSADCVLAGQSITNIGVRFKGHSSFWGYPGTKKSIKIKFDAFNEDQRLFDLTTLNFNNSFKDPTLLREKLYFDFLREEGLIVPRANFARVTINGEYWGLYVMSETVTKGFILCRFGADEDGNLFKGDPRGTLEWLGDSPDAYRRGYELATNEEEDDWTDLIELIDILNNVGPEELPVQLPQVLDAGNYARCQAANNLFVNLDSYMGTGHNYYLYHQDNQDRFYHIIWDVNEAFGGFSFGMSLQQLLNLPWNWLPPQTQNPRPLAEAILEIRPFQDIYLRSLRDMVTCRFEENHMAAQIDELANLIRPHVHEDTKKMFTNDQFELNLEYDLFINPNFVIPGLKRFVQRRRQYIMDVLSQMTFEEGLVINEVLASNKVGLTDETGEHEDWIEILNLTDSDIDIGGYYLSDNLSQTTAWQIPENTVISPEEHLVIFCDNDPEDGPLHATFKLSSAGEEVVLTAPDGLTLVDYLSFGAQDEDVSYGRYPDGAPVRQTMHPTPGTANTTAFIPVETLFFPRLSFVPNQSTEGFGFVNPGDAARVRFTAYDTDGEIVGRSDLVDWTAGGQAAFQAEGLLNLTGAVNAWVTAESDGAGLLGFFLSQMFPDGFLAGMDGAGVSTKTLISGIVPRIRSANGYTSELFIANPGGTAAEVTITGYDDSGVVNGGVHTIAARGFMSTDMESLFGDKTVFNGYLLLESTSGIVVNAVIKHGPDSISSINAIALSDASETLHAAHITMFEDVYFTELRLINPNENDALVTLSPFNPDGSAMAVPFEVLAPAHQVLILCDTELGLPDDVDSDGWLRVEAPAGNPILGCLTFGDPLDNRYESSLPLQASGSAEVYFAQVANGELGGVNFFTGIAIINPDDSSVDVTLSVHHSDGSQNGNTINLRLQPGEKYVRLLSNIDGIGVLDDQSSGYIHITATAPIFAFELFGNDEGDFLSAVPAQF